MTRLAVDCSDRLKGVPRGTTCTSRTTVGIEKTTLTECTLVPQLLKQKSHACYNAVPWLCSKPTATAMKEIIPRAIISIYLR